jgi:enolase
MICVEYAQSQSEVPSEGALIAGFKEALSIGTKKAVQMVSKTDGYFGNQAIKILLPDKMKMVADTLAQVGMQKQVDDFVLSMNRAAEKAAPQAASIFGEAIKNMSFEDANKIFSGGDTAATEFFKGKTSGKIYSAFRPIISSSMGEVGTTTLFNSIMSKYNSIPFIPKTSVDLEDYVTNKAMDGLFVTVGQEEKKIRTDPAARATDLLKSVFGQ